MKGPTICTPYALNKGTREEGYRHITHMCVTLLYLGSDGRAVRKSRLTASTLLQCALFSIVLRVLKRLRSRSNARSWRTGRKSTPARFVRHMLISARTFPLFCMIAQRCDVLFPGAAVASITTASSRAGGARTCAGKHDALSWRMILPYR